MRAAPFAAPVLLGAALVAGSAAAQAPAGTADRYGYAPPEAQVPMRLSAPRAYTGSVRPALRGPAPAEAPLPPAAAPSLRRMLNWPGKAAGPSAGPTPTPALRVPAALRTPAAVPAAAPPAHTVVKRAAWTPRARIAAPAPLAYASTPGAYAAPALTTTAIPAAYVAPSLAPVTPLQARQASTDAASTLGPPQHPWTERYGDAATAPSSGAGRGVGASLQPAPPAAPQPAPATLGAAQAAAPVRTAQASGGTARYYSLHKPYGHAPDPAPIPPQFFGPTADFSTPETPEPARASLTANPASARAAVNAARLADGATQ